MSREIRVPNAKASADEWARFWRRWGKIVRANRGANLIGMKY